MSSDMGLRVKGEEATLSGPTYWTFGRSQGEAFMIKCNEMLQFARHLFDRAEVAGTETRILWAILRARRLG